ALRRPSAAVVGIKGLKRDSLDKILKIIKAAVDEFQQYRLFEFILGNRHHIIVHVGLFEVFFQSLDAVEAVGSQDQLTGVEHIINAQHVVVKQIDWFFDVIVVIAEDHKELAALVLGEHGAGCQRGRILSELRRIRDKIHDGDK